MRTTITIEDDAFAAAKAYASAKAIKLGDAISELIRRGSGKAVPAGPALIKKDGVWLFDLPAGAPRVTAAQVRDLMDESP